MYECQRCGYNTTYITNFRKHLHTKTLCSPTLSDVSIEELREKYATGREKKEYKCEICFRKYATVFTLKRHQTKCANDISKMKEEIKGLKNQIAEIINSPIITTPNTTNTTNTTNIVINQQTIVNNHPPNPFLSENFNYLSDEYILKCAKKLNNGLIDFIKNVRFNPDHPENMNVKVHRLKNKTLFVYNENRWHVCDAKWTLEEMIVHGAKIFHQKIINHFDQEKLLEQDSSESRIQSWLLSLLPRNNEKIMGILSKRIYAMILDNHLLLMEQDQEEHGGDVTQDIPIQDVSQDIHS